MEDEKEKLTEREMEKGLTESGEEVVTPTGFKLKWVGEGFLRKDVELIRKEKSALEKAAEEADKAYPLTIIKEKK